MEAETIAALQAWAQARVSAGELEKCFVFGSLLNREGEQFDALESDIDLILQLSENGDAIARWKRIQSLRPKCALLERDLWIALKRKDPKSFLSFHLLTCFEARDAIHKGGDPQLLYTEQFFELTWIQGVPVRISDRIVSGFHDRYGDEISVLQYLQTVRSKYLKTNVHGDFELRDWDHPKDPLPKELMRECAKIAAIRRPRRFGAQPTDRTDVAAGLDYISAVIAQRSGDEGAIEALGIWLSTRRAARGTRSSMTPDQFLLIVELVYDDVVREIEVPPGRLLKDEPSKATD